MKKKLILVTLILFTYTFASSQKKYTDPIIKTNKSGTISSIKFSDKVDPSQIPSNAKAFIKEYLKPSNNNTFIKKNKQSIKDNLTHEYYSQYYKGIIVSGGGYNFHFKNGKLDLAHGNFIRVENINTTPSVSHIKAKNYFAYYKNIPTDSITDFSSKLSIEEIHSSKLVYRIRLVSNHMLNNEIGYVDAQTGEILKVIPIHSNYTGTLATRYNGTQSVTNEYLRGDDTYDGMFHLYDNSRNAKIHVMDLENDTQLNKAVELSDEDNNWTSAEYSSSEKDMAFDVFWALQKIYDHLKDGEFNINSFDNNGSLIKAYIRLGNNSFYKDNASCDPDYYYFCFGDGAVDYSPLSSIDVVAHEYGHAISGNQIGWGDGLDENSFEEGMSDIWAVIMENYIKPTQIWQTGEQITLNYDYTRNFANTNDSNAMLQIANTYGSTQYNNASDPDDYSHQYIRSGVFSHWFYLLTEGGIGTNDIGKNYTVYGIGIDISERLITKAVFGGYLMNTTTYNEIRDQFIYTAEELYGVDSWVVKQVINAWYAVNVGTQVSQPTIIGSSTVCPAGNTFSISDLPDNSSVNWTLSSNLELINSNDDFAEIKSIGVGLGWVKATIDSPYGLIELPEKIINAGIEVSFTGSSSVLYGKTGTWTANASCGNQPYSYEWYLDKVGDSDGAMLIASGNPLTLKSVPAGTGPTPLSNNELEGPIINQPTTYTNFHLYVKAYDANGIYGWSEDKTITAYGDVDLVSDFMPFAMEVSTNTETDNTETISIFPNPADQVLTIKSNFEIDLTLYNEKNKIIYDDKLYNGEINWNTSKLKEGTYYLHIYRENELVKRQILIEHK